MQMLNDRAVFEAELRKHHDGLQFVVAAEPQGDGQPWLIQRQNIVVDSDTRRPETAVEGNWYTQGSRILMAPSLLDVVQSRLLTVSTRMQRMAELAQNMSHWSPATGHTYLPPTYDVPKQASTASRAGSPVLAPTDPDAPSQSQSQSQSQPQPSLDPTTAAAHFSDDLFMRSLNLTHAYGNEYMDENPLQGEPGAFVFANSRSHVDARNKADEHASQLSQQTVPADSQLPSVAPSVVATPRTVATPRAVATPLALDAPSRKGSVAGLPKDKEEKRKRRKSRGLASPTTPSVA
jgi:mediator of RNA polymerase II transcription subunit 6